MKKISKINLLIILVATITLGLLNSCAQYQARYTPPDNPDGMDCVRSCINNLQTCNSDCNNRKMVTDIAYAVQKSVGKSPAAYHGQSDDCGCKAAYDDCYRSCGGEVNYVCVANCN